MNAHRLAAVNSLTEAFQIKLNEMFALNLNLIVKSQKKAFVCVFCTFVCVSLSVCLYVPLSLSLFVCLYLLCLCLSVCLYLLLCFSV